MNYRKMLFALIVGSMIVAGASAQRLTRDEYIQKYKNLALEHQDIYGIPASIKMAQALFESDDGNSRLCREANNHFGIKCKKEWSGPTISHTDDAPDECFRKYNSAEESFRDHSEFLDNSERYQDLFKLDPTDYKGWAYGLKKAGYATNSQYAEQLIKIIDDNQLHLLDIGQDIPRKGSLLASTATNEVVEVAAIESYGTVDVDDYVVSAGKFSDYPIYSNNGSEFTIAKEGDDLGRIASMFRTSEKKLRKFNDLAVGSQIGAGDIVYLKAKNKRSANGKLMHYVQEGETLHRISQIYGIRLKNLEKLNRRTADMPLLPGQQIRLM